MAKAGEGEATADSRHSGRIGKMTAPASMEALMLTQANQELSILREELQNSKVQLASSHRVESDLRASLEAAQAKADAALAEAEAARDAAAEAQKTAALDVQLTRKSASELSSSRIAQLEAQLQACEAACADRMTARLAALESEVEHLRERCALHEGKAQAASHEAREAELRAQVNAAKAEQLQGALEELRAELARAADEAAAARSAADKAARSEAEQKEKGTLREALLERRLAEAEGKLKASPVERDEAIAALRKSFQEITTRLHERTTEIVTREVRLRMVAEERARLRAVEAG